MSPEQKVAIVTGALQGIGASLEKAYREIGYCVVANSRSINASDFMHDPEIVTLAGDIACVEPLAPRSRAGGADCANLSALPDPLDALEIDDPAGVPQQRRNPAIPVATVLGRKRDDGGS